MISDKESNFVYFSDLIQQKAPNTFSQLEQWLSNLGIRYDFLPKTKDIWVIDFMPIQRSRDTFLQFTYDPDYLKSKKESRTRTDPKMVCSEIQINAKIVDIVLDGGNVIKSKNKVILTTKIFKENSTISEETLILQLKNHLGVNQIIIIPQEPRDPIGHADGMVRFIDDNTVMINEYPKDKTYEDEILKIKPQNLQ